MTDAWEERLKAENQIKKLISLSKNNSSPNEAKSAMEKAQVLSTRHGIDLHAIAPDAPHPKESKLAAARRNANSFHGAFSKAYTGQDDTDYVALEKERKERNKSRNEKKDFDWGDGEGY